MKNIIDIIRGQMQTQHFIPAQLSKALGVKQSTVFSMLNRRTLQVSKLADISKAMQYNFFREIAQQFPYEQPVFDEPLQQQEKQFQKEKEKLLQKIEEQKTQINRLNQDKTILQAQIKVFQEVIEKLGNK